MNINTDNQTIKRLIKKELPGLMKKDRKIREWILQLTKEQLTEKTNEIETKTESRFDRLLEELKRDREEQNKKWEENQKEIENSMMGLKNIGKKVIENLTPRWEPWGQGGEFDQKAAFAML